MGAFRLYAPHSRPVLCAPRHAMRQRVATIDAGVRPMVSIGRRLMLPAAVDKAMGYLMMFE